MDTSKVHVAVVGAGPAGLAAIKNLLDEGFQVTGFDNREAVGGIWSFTEDPNITSATGLTRAQLSKFMIHFSDLPLPDDAPRYLNAEQLAAYYHKYAETFGLLDRIVFNSTVTSLKRSDDDSKWLLTFDGESEPRAFDKVVFANGSEHKRKYPEIKNLNDFKGIYIHGQAYKTPEPFKDMNVVVIGQGNSAFDCATELIGHASSVNLAHRRGALLLSRIIDGRRMDSKASWTATGIGFWLGRFLPSVQRWLLWTVFSDAVKKSWGKLDPAWGFEPKKSYADNITALVLNDIIVPAFRDGTVKPVAGVKRVIGPKSLELSDGTVLDDVDAIIASTGYQANIDLLSPVLTYSQPHPDMNPVPELYHNIFPVNHADSLACLGYNLFFANAATARELASMAVAQIWAGKSELPSRDAMMSQIHQHQDWMADRFIRYPSLPQLDGQVEPYEFLKFVHTTAGTGLYENLGWTWAGWKFFLTNPFLYFKMVYGIMTPHIYRFFETGKRKAWDGALDAILHANEMSQIDIQETLEAKAKAKAD